jgi:hypothetical protein
MNAFDLLKFSDKLKAIKYRGEFIATVAYGQYSVSLYRVDNCLVERYFDNETKKTVKVSSARYSNLIKYLPHITISSIYTLIH